MKYERSSYGVVGSKREKWAYEASFYEETIAPHDAMPPLPDYREEMPKIYLMHLQLQAKHAVDDCWEPEDEEKVSDACSLLIDDFKNRIVSKFSRDTLSLDWLREQVEVVEGGIRDIAAKAC